MLILCGAKVTEPQYFEMVRAELSAAGISVKIAATGRSPVALVAEAERLRKVDKANAVQSGDPGNVYNAIWVVTDVDDFGPEIKELYEAGLPSGIHLAVSNPCFELWLLLHVDNCGGHLSTKQVQARAVRKGVVRGSGNKSIDTKKIYGAFEAAEARSKSLRNANSRASRVFPHDNPSTNMDVLVRNLIEAGRRSRPESRLAL